MIAVIFEAWPAEGRSGENLDLEADLKGDVEKTDGFISVERFESLATKGKVLSLCFRRDQQVLRAWRNQEGDRKAQASGPSRLFADYRLRVASVDRDYVLRARSDAPEDGRGVHG